jgi:hypothetical protein
MLNITTNFVNITNKQNHKTTLDTKTMNEYIQKPSQPSRSSDFEEFKTIYALGNRQRRDLGL